MDEKQNINININGFAASLIIDRSKEHLYREAGKVLNERIAEYNKKFNIPYTDLLNMVAFEMALEYEKLKYEKLTGPEQEIQEAIKALDSLK